MQTLGQPGREVGVRVWLGLLWLCPWLLHAAAGSVDQAYQGFRQSMLQAPVLMVWRGEDLQRALPLPLLQPAQMEPQTSRYPLDALQQLYRYQQQCQGPLPDWPGLQAAVEFERARCENRALPDAWYARSGWIHPGGGSYAARTLQQAPARRAALQPYLHLRERVFPASQQGMLAQLSRLNDAQLNRLLDGEPWIQAGGRLLMAQSGGYRVYAPEVWQPLLAQQDLHWQPERDDGFCPYPVGAGCWRLSEPTPRWLWYGIMLLLLLGVSLAMLLQRLWLRRRAARERQLILQVLTHELRTPIASLGLTIEGLRAQFDHLPAEVHPLFARLCDDGVRLRKLAEASRDYLQSGAETAAMQHLPSVAEWARQRLDETSVPLEVISDGAVQVSPYWLATCFDNLLRNAQQHGQGAIRVQVEADQKWVRLKIMDQGALTARALPALLRPFQSRQGMGLGLTIVEAMIRRMGGHLSLSGPPTCFSLVLPQA